MIYRTHIIVCPLSHGFTKKKVSPSLMTGNGSHTFEREREREREGEREREERGRERGEGGRREGGERLRDCVVIQELFRHML